MSKKRLFHAIILVILSCVLAIPTYAAVTPSSEVSADATTGGATSTADVGLMAITPTPAATQDIVFKIPSWTNKSYVTIGIETAYPPDELYARLDSQKDWTDITYDRNFKIKDNAILYVKAVTAGVEFSKSEYIGCFDRELPEIVHAINNRTINISAKDADSGIAAIYINDQRITAFSSGSTANIAITDHTVNRNDETILIYAEDNAGNISKTSTIKITSNSTSSSNNSNTSNTSSFGKAKINIIEPTLTNKSSALVKVEVSGDIDYVEAKSSRSGEWKDISSNMDFSITQNTDVYVRTTDMDGATNTVSKRIDCFDRTAPTVTMIQDGNNVNVIGVDNESGIKTLYVNGKPYNSESTTVPVTESKSFSAQATDNAGNSCALVYLKVTKVSTSTGGGSTTTAPASTPQPTTPIATNADGTAVETAADDKQIIVGTGNYTLEELKAAGVPVYIMLNVDNETLAAFLKSEYAGTENLEDDVTVYKVEDTGIEENAELLEENKPDEAVQALSTAIVDDEAKAVTAKKTSTLATVFLVIIIAIAGGAYMIFKRIKNKKFNDKDMYETEYQSENFDYDPEDETADYDQSSEF